MAAQPPLSAVVSELVPLFFVEDIGKSTAFYCDRLGFEITQKWEPDGKLAWCRLARGGAAVMLQQACEEDGPSAGRGQGVGFFFLCDDVDLLYAELSSRGLAVAPPKAAFYGMNQLFVIDPDGYELCFQCPIEGN